MATYTENLGLVKPDTTDAYSIAHFNENMDTLDTAMAEADSKHDAISEKIGEPDDTGSDTVFGKLNASGSPIKSIQYHVYTVPKDVTSGSISINTVDSAKCIVLFERLQDNTDRALLVEYTLTDSSIDLTFASQTVENRKYGFWIIEFN